MIPGILSMRYLMINTIIITENLMFQNMLKILKMIYWNLKLFPRPKTDHVQVFLDLQVKQFLQRISDRKQKLNDH